MEKKLIISILIITGVAAIGYYFLHNKVAHDSELTTFGYIPYGCEDKTGFLLQIINPEKINIYSDIGVEPIVLLRENTSDSSVEIYGNKDNAITFVKGYNTVIRTNRYGPSSTFCENITLE